MFRFRLKRPAFYLVAAVVVCGGSVAAASASRDATETSSAASANARLAGPLHTAFFDPASFAGPEQGAAYRSARQAGATYVRVLVNWSTIAPAGAVMPPGFKARDPGDPAYAWTNLDGEVRRATKEGFTPIVSVYEAPAWTQGGRKERPTDGPVRPSPAALGDFANALATRYSGRYEGLPRVRHWQVWNEPNLSIYLMPQSEGGKAVSPEWYRSLVNAFSRTAHAVRRDNVVIAGGLAPFGGDSNDPSGGNVPNQERIRPLQFMREMLCMSAGKKPRVTCNEKSEFDVWAHHPYTYGGPTHHAFHEDDVSIGDLGEMRALLQAAAKAGRITPRREPAFWVTEFSYDSKPGDPKGLPPVLHARWVSEALYRMWTNGVSLVTWFLVRDDPFPEGMFQSGVYMRSAKGIASDKPKPALRAFRFPFVAFWDKDGSISYWGRTPAGVKRAVVVEQKAGGRWRRVDTPPVSRYGIFLGEIDDVRSSGSLRARLVTGADFSQPFSLVVAKDFSFCPWGSFC